jgi:capsule polysaccharide export protein KpsE/RkpR
MADNNSQEKKKVIDLRIIVKTLLQHKKLFYISLPIAFILSSLYIICIPRYYSTEVRLAPELDNNSTGSSLGSIAASIGFDINNVSTSDAISPMLYPDLMDDNGFVSKFYNIKIKNADETINTNYHDYIKFHQKSAWWSGVKTWILKLFPKPSDDGVGKNGKFDPYVLSKDEDDVIGAMRNNIGIATDKKTGVISISVKDQDRVICKTVADSVRSMLQEFITEYRTSKARTDLEYYKKLTADAKRDYERARQIYGSYSDANTDVVLESYRTKQNDLENDMQLKFNAYTALSNQLQQAKAKVQERTPAFTLLKGATVPLKPSSPKRMIFVLAMMFLTFAACTLYSLKDILFSE